MSERDTQVGVALARSAAVGGISTAAMDATSAAAIEATVRSVPDPELPVITIGDLGMVHAVEADATDIRVAILPTFIGCPAIDLLAGAIEGALAPFGRAVTVTPTFEVPWTSDRISPRGREALLAAGIAPPAEPDDVACPYCRSTRVVMDSAFGPTQCRSLFYCRDCRQPFEAMKRV